MENSPFFEPVPETVHVEMRCDAHKSAVEIGVYGKPETIGLLFRDFLIQHAECAVRARTWDEAKRWPVPLSAPAPREEGGTPYEHGWSPSSGATAPIEDPSKASRGGGGEGA